MLATNPLLEGMTPTTPMDETIIIGIPFDRSTFKDFRLDPGTPTMKLITSYKTQSQAEQESIGPNMFAGETFKLLIIEPYSESINLIEIDHDYVLGNSLRVRFIYFRILNGQTVFTGSFGDPLMDIPSHSLVINPIETITTINQPTSNRRYYIFRVTKTPNIIFSNRAQSVQVISEKYSKDGINYRLTLPGYVYTNVSFVVYMNILDDNDEVIPPPANIRVVSNTPIEIIDISLISSTNTLKLILKTSTLNNSFDFHLYNA